MRPVPGFTGAVPFSSIHPLKTQPKPPSPRRLSGLKFLVASLNSLKVNFLSWHATFICSESLGVEELLLSVLLALVEPEAALADGWSLLPSFPGLLSVVDGRKDEIPLIKNFKGKKKLETRN